MNDELIESGIAWIGGIPGDWKIDRLKDLCLVNEQNLGNSTAKDYEFRYIDISNVNEQGIVSKDDIEPIVFEDSPSRARRIVQQGDVLISSVRPNLQAIAHISLRDCRDLIASTGFFVVHPRNKCFNNKYLHFCMLADSTKHYLIAHAKGVGYPAVADKDFGSLYLPLPPKPEQEAIAWYLETVTARIDEAIAIKQQQVAKLEAYFNERVREVMKTGINGTYETIDSGVEHLGKVPAHWKVVQLKHAVDFLNYKRVPLSSAERGEMAEKVYDYYGASGVIDQVEDFIFDEPLLLIAEDGANLLSRSSTLAFIASGQYWVNNHAHIIKPRTGDLRFWAYMLESYDYTIYVTEAAQPKLNLTNLGKMKIAIPKSAEQIVIADYLSNLQEQQDSLRETVTQQIAVLQAYRRSVIHEYVTGKKRVAMAQPAIQQ